jgi:hypothetical protein
MKFQQELIRMNNSVIILNNLTIKKEEIHKNFLISYEG